MPQHSLPPLSAKPCPICGQWSPNSQRPELQNRLATNRMALIWEATTCTVHSELVRKWWGEVPPCRCVHAGGLIHRAWISALIHRVWITLTAARNDPYQGFWPHPYIYTHMYTQIYCRRFMQKRKHSIWMWGSYKSRVYMYIYKHNRCFYAVLARRRGMYNVMTPDSSPFKSF